MVDWLAIPVQLSMKTRRGQYKAPANVMCIGKKGKNPKNPKKGAMQRSAMQSMRTQSAQCAHNAHQEEGCRREKKTRGRREEAGGGSRRQKTNGNTNTNRTGRMGNPLAEQRSTVQCQKQRSAKPSAAQRRVRPNTNKQSTAMQCNAVQHDRSAARSRLQNIDGDAQCSAERDKNLNEGMCTTSAHPVVAEKNQDHARLGTDQAPAPPAAPGHPGGTTRQCT
jgi:hypothetical protein